MMSSRVTRSRSSLIRASRARRRYQRSIARRHAGRPRRRENLPGIGLNFQMRTDRAVVAEKRQRSNYLSRVCEARPQGSVLYRDMEMHPPGLAIRGSRRQRLRQVIESAQALVG